MREFVSTFEAARILDVSPDAVRLMARSGRLEAAITTRAGRLFRRQDCERLAVERQERTGRRIRLTS
jgi:DNA-binding transcriptional MerR regulator